MTAFVLDCSIAATWLFEDEAHPETDNLRDGGAVVVEGNCTMVHFNYKNKKTLEIPGYLREKILSL